LKGKKNDSWENLKGGGQLSTKTGNGEEIRGTVSGLGSVSGLPPKEGFMNMLIRNFERLLMMGIFPTSVPGCFGDEGVCSFGFWEETFFSFLGRWGRDGAVVRGVQIR
jgi:hypothetical protein